MSKRAYDHMNWLTAPCRRALAKIEAAGEDGTDGAGLSPRHVGALVRNGLVVNLNAGAPAGAEEYPMRLVAALTTPRWREEL